MTKLRGFYLILIAVALHVTAYFLAWNVGHDVGYLSGYNQAILEGKVEVQCTFPCRDGRTREPGEQ
jgi:hypothetical protein